MMPEPVAQDSNICFCSWRCWLTGLSRTLPQLPHESVEAWLCFAPRAAGLGWRPGSLHHMTGSRCCLQGFSRRLKRASSQPGGRGWPQGADFKKEIRSCQPHMAWSQDRLGGPYLMCQSEQSQASPDSGGWPQTARLIQRGNELALIWRLVAVTEDRVPQHQV